MTEQKSVSRRNFLKGALIGTGIAVTACGSTAYLGTRTPSIPFYENIDTAQTFSKKVLVAYASKAGSTAEVAERIGRTIMNNENSVDILPAKNVSDIEQYDQVIVGSAVRMGSLLGDATNFVRDNKDYLRTIPLAYFVVCGTMIEDTTENRKEAAGYLQTIKDIAEPQQTGLFAGKFDFSRLSFIFRTMMSLSDTKEGDWRDWPAIESWAAQLV